VQAEDFLAELETAVLKLAAGASAQAALRVVAVEMIVAATRIISIII